ncbi:MAG: DegT/DnrJ/EryC1/StrS family aminotransferase [Thermomicrobiales bacterium]
MVALAKQGGLPIRTKPFSDWPVYGKRERENLLEALESGIWSSPEGGPFVTAFEQGFAHLQGTSRAVAVTNGTVSLVLSLRALGIGAGDEVIVPPYTFLATATAVLEVNALPIFADVDPDTYCIDPDAVGAAITERTKAIIPVHLGGQPADMDRLATIARKHGLAIIEDAAHAHGSIWDGKPVGSMGDLGSFSMQASKNLNSGEGGAVVSNNDDLAERVISLRNCGRVKGGVWYEHREFGGNFRLTEFQAAVLVAQLERYPAQLARRNANGQYLNAGLAEIDGILPQKRDPRTDIHAHHLYSFRYDADAFHGLSRADFTEALRAEGIPAGTGYPMPLNKQPIFTEQHFDVRATGYNPAYAPTQYDRLDLPNCQTACDDVVWIPQTVLLGDERDMNDVVAAVQKVHDAVEKDGRRAVKEK